MALPPYELLSDIGNLTIYVFVLSSMFLTGLMVTIGELVAPVRNRRLLSLALVSNFIIVPAIALTLIALIPMNPELAAGLLLVSIAAGAPSTAKVAQITGGNMAQAVSMTILMTIVTVLIMPFLLPFILEGAQIDPLFILANLVILVLVPIACGIVVRNRSGSLADRLVTVMDWISNLSIAVIFLTYGTLFLSQFGGIIRTSSGAIAVPVAIVFTLAAIGITYLIGRSETDARMDLAIGAGFRNITAALVVIFASFEDFHNDVFLMVLMVSIFAVIIVSILVGIIYKKQRDAGNREKGSGA